MSYCATFSGEIELKEDKYSDIVAKLAEDILNVDDVYSNGGKCLDISGAMDSRYHEEDWGLFYKEIAPYITFCETEFEGEDGTHWKQSFEDGMFKEYQGKIVYENPSVFISKDDLETDEDKEL